MAGDRRYRQQGYRDRTEEKRERADKVRPPEPGASWGLGRHAVSRCAECGTLLPAATDSLGRCLKCGSELHACKQCAHFEPARPLECAQPIPERIPDKVARNDCGHFSLRVTLERDTASGSMRPEDARRTFDSLFKRDRP